MARMGADLWMVGSANDMGWPFLGSHLDTVMTCPYGFGFSNGNNRFAMKMSGLQKPLASGNTPTI